MYVCYSLIGWVTFCKFTILKMYSHSNKMSSKRSDISIVAWQKLYVWHCNYLRRSVQCSENDKLEGNSKFKHRWNDGKERTTTVFNEQRRNYSLRLFSSLSLSFQHCLCNRKENVDSRFHTLTIHTKKKPWRV